MNKNIDNSIKGKVIRFFGLKGSWSWAKKQMLKGEYVRCEHWAGALHYRVDKEHQTRLEANFTRGSLEDKWETSNHFLSYEDFTDYVIKPRNKS